MVFRNMELNFDIFDADTAEAYEQAVQTVLDGAVALPEETLADGIRRQCGLVFGFFDALFGEGFHRELFGARTNLMECLTAFREFLSLVAKQRESLDAMVSEVKTENAASGRAALHAVRRLPS